MQKGLRGALNALRSVGAYPGTINESLAQFEPPGTILWEGECRHGYARLIKGPHGADSYEVSF